MNSASSQKNGEKIMNKKTILCALASVILFPVLVRAQAGPAENGWGLDYQGKAIVAVLPLAGEETEMALQFYKGIMEAVAALQKYNPQEVPLSAFSEPEREIPTDMPPNRDRAAGARYALTGGVYPGNRSGDYYLQLWLWDMRGSTMIYTDDLVYQDAAEAMGSVPGLVEWLFSHIREVPLEEPEVKAVPDDPLFTAGLKIGLSPRWFVDPEEISPGAWALAVEGGIFGTFRLSRLFSLQAEILFTEDTLVERAVRQEGTAGIPLNDKYRTLSLMFPLLFKVNLRPGPFLLSPLAGLYLMAPLGKTQYRRNPNSGNEEHSFSWSYSIPLGFTVGLEAAVQSGPGFLMAGMRYAGDIGAADINFGDVDIDYGGEISQGKKYRRRMFSIYVGYSFGFFETKK
jgi:hypothetical protein